MHDTRDCSGSAACASSVPLATALRDGDPDAEWVELQLVEQGIRGEA